MTIARGQPPLGPGAYRKMRFAAVVAAVIFGGLASENALAVADAWTWPTTPGVVRSAGIGLDSFHTPSKYGTHTEVVRTLRVEYVYVVGATTYRGSRIGLRRRDRRAVGDSTDYPVGSHVTVHYQRRNPSLSVLETRIGWKTALDLTGAVICAFVARFASRRIKHAPAAARAERREPSGVFGD